MDFFRSPFFILVINGEMYSVMASYFSILAPRIFFFVCFVQTFYSEQHQFRSAVANLAPRNRILAPYTRPPFSLFADASDVPFYGWQHQEWKKKLFQKRQYCAVSSYGFALYEIVIPGFQFLKRFYFFLSVHFLNGFLKFYYFLRFARFFTKIFLWTKLKV